MIKDIFIGTCIVLGLALVGLIVVLYLGNMILNPGLNL